MELSMMIMVEARTPAAAIYKCCCVSSFCDNISIGMVGGLLGTSLLVGRVAVDRFSISVDG